MYVLLLILSMLNISIAEESGPNSKIRLGICGGFSPQCLITTAQVDIAGDQFGISLGLFPTVSVVPRYYLPLPKSDQDKWKPYIYGGVGFFPAIDGGLDCYLGFVCLPRKGVGIGTDIMLFKSKQIILQPTVGVGQMQNTILFDSTLTSASLSILYQFDS